MYGTVRNVVSPDIVGNPLFAWTFIRAERCPGGRLKKWCYSAARKKRKKKRGREKTDETIFMGAVKAFNAIRTKHSRLIFLCAGFSRKLSFVLGRLALWKIYSTSKREVRREREREKEREREDLNEKPLLMCAVHWPSKLHREPFRFRRSKRIVLVR